MNSGTIVLANFSPALEAGNLGKYGSFVALVQSIAAEVGAAANPRPPALAGEPLHYTFPTGINPNATPIDMIGPDGRQVFANITSQPNAVEIDVAKPDLPGFYQLRLAGQTIATLAVNLDPRESDLRIVDRAELLRHISPNDAASQAGNSRAATPLPLSHGTPLWGWALAAALMVLAIELILLGAWKP